MTPLLIVKHTETGITSIDTVEDLRNWDGAFEYLVVNNDNHKEVLATKGEFANYDDARIAGVTALDRVLDGK